jgi:hypothetical protein
MTTADSAPAPSAAIRLAADRTRHRRFVGTFLLAALMVVAWGALRDSASAQTAPAIPAANDAAPTSTPSPVATGLSPVVPVASATLPTSVIPVSTTVLFVPPVVTLTAPAPMPAPAMAAAPGDLGRVLPPHDGRCRNRCTDPR